MRADENNIALVDSVLTSLNNGHAFADMLSDQLLMSRLQIKDNRLQNMDHSLQTTGSDYRVQTTDYMHVTYRLQSTIQETN